jgi:hypothetical protein
MPRDDELHALTDSLIYELVKAFALPQTIFFIRLVERIFGKAAARFAKTALQFDRIIGTEGLDAAAHWILPRFVQSHSARGVENIPAEGPLIIASNHPAAYDAVVITAYVMRPDFKVIIGEIPFFKHLPHLRNRAIFTASPNDTSGRMRAAREIIRHLKNDGAILIFARGGIEADPSFMPNADAEFGQWSRSLELFLRQAPQTKVLATMVSGVIEQTAMRHPITWFRRARPDRQRLAYIYQIARQTVAGRELYGLTPHVTFGELVSGMNREHVLSEIENAARRTLSQHMTWKGA